MFDYKLLSLFRSTDFNQTRIARSSNKSQAIQQYS